MRAHPLAVPLAYFALYVTIAALSIPGAAALTLVGGALFGVVLGTVLVSFASAIGATLAFLVARTLLGDWVQQRFADRLQQVNEGIERDGALYLATAAADRRVSVLAREPADGTDEICASGRSTG